MQGADSDLESGPETVPGLNSLWLTTTDADANGGRPADSGKVFQVDLS
ncbi:hypothetical protein ACFYPC_26340 [Streptomyces sp. NPDC005808]